MAKQTFILLLMCIPIACGPTFEARPDEPDACTTVLTEGAATLDMDCSNQCNQRLVVPDGYCAVVSVYPESGALLDCAVFTGQHDFECADGSRARVWVEALVNGECQRSC